LAMLFRFYKPQDTALFFVVLFKFQKTVTDTGIIKCSDGVCGTVATDR